MSERNLTDFECDTIFARFWNSHEGEGNWNGMMRAAYARGRSDERAEHKCKLPESINEALNSGMGVYKP